MQEIHIFNWSLQVRRCYLYVRYMYILVTNIEIYVYLKLWKHYVIYVLVKKSE